MYYGNINKFDIANGEGIRTTLFVSGCTNRCKGCFQPETWAFDYGAPFTDEVAEDILSTFEQSAVKGLTILGGEPMEPSNQRELLPFLKEFKRRYPNKTLGFLQAIFMRSLQVYRVRITSALISHQSSYRLLTYLLTVALKRIKSSSVFVFAALQISALLI
jgi:organic radical activating enzyme